MAALAFKMDAVSVLYKNTGILDKVVFVRERLHDDATCFASAGEALFSRQPLDIFAVVEPPSR